MFHFHLAERSGVSFYVQLIQQVQRAIRFGLLGPGDQLPTVREVAASVAVNPNTVLRAYRELDQRGLVVMRAGSGTFIAPEARAAIDTELYESLSAELKRWVEDARQLGVDDESLKAIFDHVLDSQREVVMR